MHKMTLPEALYITGPKEDFENLSWVHGLHEKRVGGIIQVLDENDFYRDHPEKHFLAYFHEKAEQMKIICEALGMKFLVADNFQVAHFSGSDGIHLTKENLDLFDLKKENPELIIGLGREATDQALFSGYDAIDYVMLSEEISIADYKDRKRPFYLEDVSSGLWMLY